MKNRKMEIALESFIDGAMDLSPNFAMTIKNGFEKSLLEMIEEGVEMDGSTYYSLYYITKRLNELNRNN